jgi:type I restriction enzyme S subunit
MDQFDLKIQPDDWQMVPIDDCCEQITQSCDPAESNGKPYFGLEHLASGFPAFVGIGDPRDVRSAKTLFQVGDILYGKLRPYLRKAALATVDGICSTDIIVLRTRNKMLAEFATYLVHSNQFINRAKATTTGVNHPRTSWNKLKQFIVPRPPLDEQRKIATVLSTVQRAIEQQDRLIALTSEFKKAVMQKFFTEGTFGEPQKETEIGRMPESWGVKRIVDLCEIKASAMSYGQLEESGDTEGGVETFGVKVSDMNLPGNDSHFRVANLVKKIPTAEAIRRTIPTDAIVFPKRGAAIATNKKRITTCWTVLDPNLIAVIPSDAVNHRYLFHWFNTFDLARITDPGPTPQLNKKDIAPVKFPYPELTEQLKIADSIDTVEQKIEIHSRKRNALLAVFCTLLHQLMTAQIRVHDLDLSKLGVDSDAPEVVEVA